jgi:hypothetical protein
LLTHRRLQTRESGQAGNCMPCPAGPLAEPGMKEFRPELILAFERRPMKSGRWTVTLIVEREPIRKAP